MNQIKKIVVTGASGFLGRHALPILQEKYGPDRVVGLNSKDFNLINPDGVRRLLEKYRPDILVHLAAYSGGIAANRTYPADFYYRNTLLTALMFEAAKDFKVNKLIYPMGGCAYPATATSPINELEMWNGFPQQESASYSVSKKMGLIASKAYKTQYGLNSVVIVPGNMYGEFDNFHSLDSHVIPAMIRRYFEAQRDNLSEVVMWGTGRPTRDFVYAGDVASLLPFFIENNDETGPVNLSTGTRISIRELAETIAELVGFKGRIVWDSTKPDGQIDKIFAVDKMKSLGLSCRTSLRDGLSRTIRWFSTHYTKQTDGIRL